MAATVDLSDEGLPGPASPSLLSRQTATLNRVLQLQRGSAFLQRSHGMEVHARHAEQAAARIHASLEDPMATRRMFASAQAVRETLERGLVFERALEGAMALLGADLGNVQLRDRPGGPLRIVAHAGFDSEFLEYFAEVTDDTSACGRAAHDLAQVAIADVDEDASFRPHLEIAAASRFRAVQSTPIVDGKGRLVGIVSTHFRYRRRLSPRELVLMEWYAEEIGEAVARGANARA